jgi:hypothetical protein
MGHEHERQFKLLGSQGCLDNRQCVGWMFGGLANAFT